MPEYTRRYTFFESFYRATKYMSDKQELEFRRALDKLAFEGEEPEFDDPLLLSNWEQTCTTLARSIKYSEAGSAGGRSKGASKGNGQASKGASKPSATPSKGASNHKKCKEKECKEKEGEREGKLRSFYTQAVTM